MTNKICATCKIEKDITLFWKNITQKDGHDSRCASCRRAYKNQFYQDNKDKEKTRLLLRKKTAAGKVTQSNYSHRRRQLMKQYKDNTVTQEALDDILLTQNCLCNICKTNIENRSNRHLDHIYPLSKGGLHTISNLQWLCPSCNMKKGCKLPCYGEL